MQGCPKTTEKWSLSSRSQKMLTRLILVHVQRHSCTRLFYFVRLVCVCIYCVASLYIVIVSVVKRVGNANSFTPRIYIYLYRYIYIYIYIGKYLISAFFLLSVNTHNFKSKTKYCLLKKNQILKNK